MSTASDIPEQRAGGPRAGGVGRAGGLVSTLGALASPSHIGTPPLYLILYLMLYTYL